MHMVSDKRGGPQGGSGAGRGPLPVVSRPGSVNRGFASVDPERQCETGVAGGKAADGGEDLPGAPGHRAPASGSGAQPQGTRGGRRKPPSGEEGGAA